ncbi:hypothetical protein ACFOY2_12720 [Nonomuraea purpurea]|uniref:ABM domain-containing protein n=1 Tax=Nonomuraea purpurea TaxID=1849276 RepID=A0ABV8G277_9ACTN
MAILRMTRFTADPADADQVIARRNDLITAVRAAYPGLTETRLARIDEHTWVDSWRWESPATMEAALAGAPSLPQAEAAFSILKGHPTAEQGEIVDER